MTDLVDNIDMDNNNDQPDQEPNDHPDTGNVDDPTPDTNPDNNAQIVPEWFYDEDQPGEGEKPEWLSDKYKSVAEQAKAYKGLEKKIGNFQGAPEEYNLDFKEELGVEINPDDPLMDKFIQFSKENNVSQDFFGKMMGMYVEAIESATPDPKKEMEKLGVHAEEEIKVLAQWASNNLSREDYEQFKGMMNTAENVKLFNKIRTLSTSSPVAKEKASTNTENEAQIRKMVHDPRFETDEMYRKMVEQKLRRLKG